MSRRIGTLGRFDGTLAIATLGRFGGAVDEVLDVTGFIRPRGLMICVGRPMGVIEKCQ